MRTIRIAFRALAIVAGGVALQAAAQKGELEVTMRVLDDVRDIDAVIVAIGAPEETATREDTNHGERVENALEDRDVAENLEAAPGVPAN